MKTINWGIIGCGDVAEVKSGPAFQKAPDSRLLAVMRRNAQKAQDFALRHEVPSWYTSAKDVLENDQINAVYVATPPDSHLELALAALDAGKHVYLEKPMTLNAAQAEKLVARVETSSSKLTVAHYRRQLPAFLKVKELLEKKAIGEVRFADIQILQPPKSQLVADSETNWRVEAHISGGGYFHDLAPHQMDLMTRYFGRPTYVDGFGTNQAGLYRAEDIVTGIMHFESGVHFRGTWCFNAAESSAKDQCVIHGSHGRLEFSFFGDQVVLINNEGSQTFSFDSIPHVQQPMIEATVAYFLGRGPNPCTAEEGLEVMRILDRFSTRPDAEVKEVRTSL